jgi:mersacidin/lichenicidin family type 2 lantibiotic
MSIADIIRAWKDEDETKQDEKIPQNPAGQQELTDKELEAVVGGMMNPTRHDAC